MLRLTGGEFRGRMIHTPAGDRTRPTQAKLRQALFNSLQAEIPGAKVLDLFAGSGALGFEALSRGAERVVFVENSRQSVKLIQQNIGILKVEERVMVLAESVDRIWPRLESQAPFDLVLADPPYAGGWEERLLSELPWQKLLRDGAHFSLEWGVLKSKVAELPEKSGLLLKTREKNYGDSVLTTYVLKGSLEKESP